MAQRRIPDHWVEEIPFDVSDWGDRVVPPLYANDAERAEAAAAEPTEEFKALLARAQQLSAARLDPLD